MAGAKKSGLHPDYIAKLEAQETFVTPGWVLEERKRYPKPEELGEITKAELSKHKGNDPW